MKDSSVDPTGLFDPRRQKRLLDGLAERFRYCTEQQKQLCVLHQNDRVKEAVEFEGQLNSQKSNCAIQRREMLDHWDREEERITATYESTTLKQREQLNRLAVLFRRKKTEEERAIDRKVEARRQAVEQQYQNRKNQPGLQKRKDHRLIDESLEPMVETLEWGRAVTIRRLDGLMEVPRNADPCVEFAVDHPTTVKDAVEAIGRLTRQCEKTVEQMQTGAASKTVDSFYLPAGVAVFIAIWAVVAFAMAPPPPWMAMAAGVPVAGVLGFTIYAILLWPLKKMTRQLYPEAERLGHAAQQCADIGKALSTKTAKNSAADLVNRRKEHLAAADKWRSDHIDELTVKLEKEQAEAKAQLQTSLQQTDQAYTTEFEDVSAQMRIRADELAGRINQTLTSTSVEVEERKLALDRQRKTDLKRLSERLKQGVARGLGRIRNTATQVDRRFPSWDAVLADTAQANPADANANLNYLPIGSLQVHAGLRQTMLEGLDSETTEAWLTESEIPQTLPVVLHRRVHNGVIIRAGEGGMQKAIEIAHLMLWRTLSGAPPARAKLTLIDPLGRGQHFTSFMALADHDPAIVGHRVWTTDNKIDERLGELAHHVEDVLQSILRDQFQRIEDYNEVAGSMAEPYRVVAAIGFPEGLTRGSYKHLRAIIESGMRCGIFTVLVCDADTPWPADMPLPNTERLLNLRVDDDGTCRVDGYGLDDLPLVPDPSPPVAMRGQLIQQIGAAVVAASRVEIPLASLLDDSKSGTESTVDGIEIPVGSQGANRSLALDLGEGVRQHVLIAGKTGSGKSTLLHSIITSGIYHYRPDQLEYYLLDFKKGVEFKSYADCNLPHARVIGIESEREFGRSVLQRLDTELQQRGEAFRAAGVQELGDYRKATGISMPRIMLVIDEFQELFVRDDRLAGDCSMLLDRLVRQGRSFGIHVILSSQSLAGAYSLPRATLGQMAVRIAMQCSESDAALILADDNTAARLISRPGEAIYNDAGGLVEGNQPFQVAWLAPDKHKEILAAVASRDREFVDKLPPPVVFEGNRPCRWIPALADAALNSSTDDNALTGLLGEAVEIGPPVSLELTRNTGRNVLVMGPAEGRSAVLGVVICGFAKSHPELEVIYFDGNRVDDGEPLSPWLSKSGVNVSVVKPRDSDAKIAELAALVKNRGEESTDHPIVVVIDPLERFRDLRQEESFNFSLDGPAAVSGSAALQAVLRDGPGSNVFVALACGSAETLTRWLPRSAHHDLELRVLGRMNASDSSMLIDTPMASDLSAATMLVYDDTDGRITKFRQCDLPSSDDVRQWLQM